VLKRRDRGGEAHPDAKTGKKNYKKVNKENSGGGRGRCQKERGNKLVPWGANRDRRSEHLIRENKNKIGE